MVTINAQSGQPVYEQIVAQIKQQLVTGALRPGDGIPSVRKLSLLIGVNPNTVARAYQELERQGLIVTAIGRGTSIAAAPSLRADGEELAGIRARISALIMDMKLMGMDKAQILMEIEQLYREMEGVQHDT